MEYLIFKTLHILSATFLFGTGIGTAFYLLFVSLSRDVVAIAVVSRWVVRADWLFTATTIVFQPLSGWYLLHLSRVPLSSAWVWWSLVLYGVAVLCWLPVVVIQMRLRDIAAEAASKQSDLPPQYWKLLRVWVILGIPALFCFLAIFFLMVAKPY